MKTFLLALASLAAVASAQANGVAQGGAAVVGNPDSRGASGAQASTDPKDAPGAADASGASGVGSFDASGTLSSSIYWESLPPSAPSAVADTPACTPDQLDAASETQKTTTRATTCQKTIGVDNMLQVSNTEDLRKMCHDTNCMLATKYLYKNLPPCRYFDLAFPEAAKFILGFCGESVGGDASATSSSSSQSSAGVDDASFTGNSVALVSDGSGSTSGFAGIGNDKSSSSSPSDSGSGSDAATSISLSTVAATIVLLLSFLH